MVRAVEASAGSLVRQAIQNAASATGVDFSYLYSQARIESGFDPGARATGSSATGLYQFIEQSWLGTIDKHGGAHGLGWAANAITRARDGRYSVADPAMRSAVLGLRNDAQASASMAAEFASDNRAYLEARLGRAVEPVDLYLAHFLGPAGAAKFLTAQDANPGVAAAGLFPAASRSNRAVFYERDGTGRSLGEVRARFAAKLGGPDDTSDIRHAELGSASKAQQTPSARVSGWTLKQVQGDGGVGREGAAAKARLAYLMLASLGVSA